jgi:hypothetical protein
MDSRGIMVGKQRADDSPSASQGRPEVIAIRARHAFDGERFRDQGATVLVRGGRIGRRARGVRGDCELATRRPW